MIKKELEMKVLDLNTYQKEALKTARFGPVNAILVKPLLLALANAGKVAERFKKAFRDNGGKLSLDSESSVRTASRVFEIQTGYALTDAKSKKTLEYANEFIYPVLGLVGEAGETAEKVLAIVEQGMTTERREEVIMEVADVLWYVAALSHTLGYSLEEVAAKNIDKLHSRQERGKIHGEGDNR